MGGESVGGRVGPERGRRGIDSPSSIARERDRKEGEGVWGEAAKTRARPAGERSENVDPKGVGGDAAVGLAPIPEAPGRVAGAGADPEESDSGTALVNEARVCSTWVDRVCSVSATEWPPPRPAPPSPAIAVSSGDPPTSSRGGRGGAPSRPLHFRVRQERGKMNTSAPSATARVKRRESRRWPGIMRRNVG